MAAGDVLRDLNYTWRTLVKARCLYRVGDADARDNIDQASEATVALLLRGVAIIATYLFGTHSEEARTHGSA